jgi:CRISPR-associated protein Csy1
MTTAPDPEHVQRLLASGRWREARPLLRTLLASRPHEPAVLHALCEAEIMDGAAADALQRLEALPRPLDPDAAFLHARAQAALGRDSAAREELHALRERLPRGSAHLELHLAAIEERLGNAAAAVESLRTAVALEPGSASAHAALAARLDASGDHEGACHSLAKAAEAAPADVDLRIALARAQARLARPREALATLREALGAGPHDAAQWHAIGQLFAEHFEWQAAGEALAGASRLAPGEPGVETLLAVVSQELGEMDVALQALGRAAARAPDDLNAAVARRLVLPQVYEDEGDLAHWRARYVRGLAELADDADRWGRHAAQVFELNRTNFLLAYQGEDDLPLQRDYSRFVGGLARAAWPAGAEPLTARFEGGRRLRVGFASSFFRDCTVGRYFERWITTLDARRFERFVYHAGALSDDFTQRLAARSDRFTLLRSGSLAAAKRLRGDDLDVLVYPEVGMDPIGYLLGALRLAPVQIAAWGHPVTTGSEAIDHFLTVDGMEPGDAAAHYVERLLALPGPGVDYAMPGPPPAATRAEFGLRDDARLYVCPQSLFKIHPAMDDALAAIAGGDPDGQLVFFQGQAAAITERFGERLQRALARRGVPPRRQVKFMPRMGSAAFRALLGVADVVLDTFHWSGGNTSFDAFSVATPVVTLPGRFMRGRQTMAMLGALGVRELIAATPDDYVDLALRVARDRDLNRALRERLVAGREAIFERREPVIALGEALLAAASRGV